MAPMLLARSVGRSAWRCLPFWVARVWRTDQQARKVGRLGCRAGQQAIATRTDKVVVRAVAAIQMAPRPTRKYRHHCTPTSGQPQPAQSPTPADWPVGWAAIRHWQPRAGDRWRRTRHHRAGWPRPRWPAPPARGCSTPVSTAGRGTTRPSPSDGRAGLGPSLRWVEVTRWGRRSRRPRSMAHRPASARRLVTKMPAKRCRLPLLVGDLVALVGVARGRGTTTIQAMYYASLSAMASWVPQESAQRGPRRHRRLSNKLTTRANAFTCPPSSVGRAHPW
jgi:hypothetical protein